jgi:hypothetical protein
VLATAGVIDRLCESTFYFIPLFICSSTGTMKKIQLLAFGSRHHVLNPPPMCAVSPFFCFLISAVLGTDYWS